MDEDDAIDLSELPEETQEWLRRVAVQTGDAPEVVLINCMQVVQDLVDFTPDPNAPRALCADVLSGIRIALVSIDSPTVPVIDRILATQPLPPDPNDEAKIPLYRIHVSLQEAASVYGQLLKAVLAKGRNTPFGKFPIRVLLAFWQREAFAPTS